MRTRSRQQQCIETGHIYKNSISTFHLAALHQQALKRAKFSCNSGNFSNSGIMCTLDGLNTRSFYVIVINMKNISVFESVLCKILQSYQERRNTSASGTVISYS